MSCIAVSVSSRSASGVDLQEGAPARALDGARRPRWSAAGTSVSSGPIGSRSSYSNSATVMLLREARRPAPSRGPASVGPGRGTSPGRGLPDGPATARPVRRAVSAAGLRRPVDPRWWRSDPSRRRGSAGRHGTAAQARARSTAGAPGHAGGRASRVPPSRPGGQQPRDQPGHEGVAGADGVDDRARPVAAHALSPSPVTREDDAVAAARDHDERGAQLAPSGRMTSGRRLRRHTAVRGRRSLALTTSLSGR